MFYDDIKASADLVAERIHAIPSTAVILGSGLGNAADSIENPVIIPFSDIPLFPHSSIAGHQDRMIFGNCKNKECVMIQGRFHYYEGFSMKQVCSPVYLMNQIGVQNLIITNACGGINPSFKPGDLMLIEDFINTVGNNSLIGENDERLTPRFPDMSEPYSRQLRIIAEKAASDLSIRIQKGVYALFSGPCYETKAEIHALSVMGADAVGMSTVPETIAANALGMNVLGIACITNLATGLAKEKHSHEEVLKTAEMSAASLSRWILKIIENIQ